MGNVQFRNGKVLFTATGKVAMDPACCCTAASPCTTCAAATQNAAGVSGTCGVSTPSHYYSNVLSVMPGSFVFCTAFPGSGFTSTATYGCTWMWTATVDLTPMGLPGYVYTYCVQISFDAATGKFVAFLYAGSCPDGYACDERMYTGDPNWCASNPAEANTIACGSDGKLHGTVVLHGLNLNAPNTGTATVTVTLP